MEKALGLLSGSYRETDLGSSPWPWGGNQGQQPRLWAHPMVPWGGTYIPVHPESPVRDQSLLISYVTFAYKSTHRLSQEGFPLADSCFSQ